MMTDHTARLRAEDVVLTVLCTLSGPLFWWAGVGLTAGARTASPLHTVEQWLAGGLAALGALIALWWIVAVAGALLAAGGTRARSSVLASWGRRLSPAFLRRVAAVALGVQVATAGGAWAAPSLDTGGTDRAAAVSVHETPQSDWAEQPTPRWTHQVASMPVLVSAEGSDAPRPHGPDDSVEPPSPGWAPAPPQTRPLGSTTRATADAPTVTVRQGDCLWDIAAEELGPHATDLEIDRRWRAWHRANLETIGPDPHHLVPGTVLTSPAWT